MWENGKKCKEMWIAVEKKGGKKKREKRSEMMMRWGFDFLIFDFERGGGGLYVCMYVMNISQRE